MAPLPMLIDTDIGSDVDDAFAALFALASPELQVRGFTVVHGDVELRARILMKLLGFAGRADVPVGLGRGAPLTPGAQAQMGGHEGRGLLDAADKDSPLHVASAQSMLKEWCTGAAGGALVTIGPLTNVALTLSQSPPRKPLRITAMGGHLGRWPPGRPRSPEYNVSSDPDATQAMFEWADDGQLQLSLVPLDVTMRVSIGPEEVAELEAAGTPLGSAMASMTRIWIERCGGTRAHMHDPLAVALTFAPDLAGWEELRVKPVQCAEGVLLEAEDSQAPNARVAIDVDAGGFRALFWPRIMRSVRGE